ncbi:hypothetical protein J4760_02700 [Salinicoccus sp. ID82-1]|uniref:hypothetical protein n=1 Tax=Salinicoccus sp. ID82-1 TaxID=2820269 RepID=UPI001F485ECA|nr:hypothetical protein [Salinicoccus sp. ID82-1]MCG1008958.1 hypothetical protein [Salinicoccus sp. ID82-1]
MRKKGESHLKNLSIFEKINFAVGWVFLAVGAVLVVLNMDDGLDMRQQLVPLAFIILGLSLLFIPGFLKGIQIGRRK